METPRRRYPKFLLPVLLVLLCLCITAIVVISAWLKVDTKETAEAYLANGKKYHIIVTGSSENESFLKQVYKGASQVSDSYDAVVELAVPESQAEDVSLQSQLDYCSFAGCDGVIAYINSEKTTIVPPETDAGKVIPLITVGHYSPLIPQLSFIGTNYSELGITLSRLILSYLKNERSLLIVNTNNRNDPNYSILMNTLTNTMANSPRIITEMLNYNSGGDLSIEDIIRKKLTGSDSVDLIVCLKEDDTIRVAQTVTDLNKVGEIKILGFGESPEALQYYNKGIITCMLSQNLVKIGETAMKEMFEYKNNGSANSFITADVQILPEERK
ncbi:MAG: substrate-binding domain-containing protein [Treponema sp.]|jgi:ribose transport system substrate-binding protein|nr:substrate-binding domain-containing protein [Treponema sp.]